MGGGNTIFFLEMGGVATDVAVLVSIWIVDTSLFFQPPTTTRMTSNVVVKHYSLCYNPSLGFTKSDDISLLQMSLFGMLLQEHT